MNQPAATEDLGGAAITGSSNQALRSESEKRAPPDVPRTRPSATSQPASSTVAAAGESTRAAVTAADEPVLAAAELVGHLLG